MAKYAPMEHMPEDERIRRIGEMLMLETAPDKECAICTDAEGADGLAKAQRYARKLKERFPNVQVLRIAKGPTAGVVTIFVAPPTYKPKAKK